MVILITYIFGQKKYLAGNESGHITVEARKDAKVFKNKDEALKLKKTLLNSEDFFFETFEYASNEDGNNVINQGQQCIKTMPVGYKSLNDLNGNDSVAIGDEPLG